ncbi:MAG: hypothetical protein HY718_12440 [Planctomycetes bacterium]|nr:hypothetical protein [Planctomycetota bacterium]
MDCATGMGVGASDCAVVNCTFKKCANTAVSWSSGAPSNLRFQNNIFFKNTFVAKGPSSPGFIFSHNILFQNTTASNEQGMQALGVENLVVDPQFVVDDLFSTNVELKPTSPAILAGVDLEGQRTRNIGARGPGLVAGTETTASPLNFALWKDQNGALTATSSAVLLDTDGSLLLKPGVTTAVLRSPVIDVATLLNRSNMRLKAIRLDTLEAAAIGKLVDSDPATPEREFRFRVNGTSFSEIEDAAALPFVTATHGQILLTPQANFVQIEVTLRQP